LTLRGGKSEIWTIIPALANPRCRVRGLYNPLCYSTFDGLKNTAIHPVMQSGKTLLAARVKMPAGATVT